MYICLLPQNQLFCQQIAITTIQLDYIAIHMPSLLRIERGLGWKPLNFVLELRKILLSYRNPWYNEVYLSAARKPALVPASRYNYNVDCPYNNTHTKFD